MNQAPPPSGGVDLTNCDREPIHLLGAIQPFGFLLSVNADWVVVRASENTHTYLRVDHGEIIGQPVDRCISPDVVHQIRGRLQIAAGPDVVERLFDQRLGPDGAAFDVVIHQSGTELVLEFEPSGEQVSAAPAALKAIFARVERYRTQQDLCREAARQVRALTAFDRVMVYRFDDDGAGEVVAELARSGMSPFLGLRYPASDIPAQARALYEKNILRIIVDVDAEPVVVTPALSPEGAALDLSMSVLRSVSPIHLEYLRNMGVRASMSISILRSGRLWGLIACHHDAPHRVGLHTRSMAELFGQMFSYLMESRCREQEGMQDERSRDIRHRIALAFAAPDASLKGVPEWLAGIGDFIAADGIGAYQAGEITLTGLTPTREEFVQLIRFLNKTASGRVWSTHCLADVFPPAADFIMRAAGLLSVPISRVPRDYLIFFRREVVQTVTWAGEPTKVEVIGPNGPRLTPRKSFEAWQETVRNQSERWGARDLRAAEALRITLVELVLRMSETARADRIGAEQRSEMLIAELNHRVRNILGLVRGVIAQSATHTDNVTTLVNGLTHRIASLARAYDLLSISKWDPTSLHDLLRTEFQSYDGASERLSLSGPDVMLQPKAFSAMALVAHELMTNARKYGALSQPAGQIAIETSSDAIGNVAISWRESGGPRVTAPTRRGFGTTILEQVIPFEVDGSSLPGFHPTGFVLDIVLPPLAAACVSGPAAVEPSRQEGGQVLGGAAFVNLLRTCLVVEDNLFIALDVEEILHRLGADRVDLAKSVAEAMALKAQRRYSFALLDVNLGAENSLPVARALLVRGTPFVFGTGYGETHTLDATLAAIPIVSKPYHPDGIAESLARLLPREGKLAEN